MDSGLRMDLYGDMYVVQSSETLNAEISVPGPHEMTSHSGSLHSVPQSQSIERLKESPRSVHLPEPTVTLQSTPVTTNCCDYIHPESRERCTKDALFGNKCGRHGGGRRCSYIYQNGDKCETRAHAKGKCSKHGASRCQHVDGCDKHYVLRGLCTTHFKKAYPNEIEALRKRQQGAGKSSSNRHKKIVSPDAINEE